MTISVDGYELNCDVREDGLYITDFTGAGAVLDLRSHDDIIGIDKKVFLCCRSVRKVFLPGSIRTLGDWCFSKCDNLVEVSFDMPARGDIFGRGVFEGCDMLSSLYFTDSTQASAALLAASVSRMPGEHLLKADDQGSSFWYSRWDITLMSLLSADDAENSISVAVSGEEDISYDGLGSIDGEMPGTPGDYVKNVAVNKCILCYMRLSHDDFLSSDNRKKIEDYINDRAFGCVSDSAWITVKEAGEKALEYIVTYMSVVKPDHDVVKEMINDLDQSGVQIRAYLIGEAGRSSSATFPFDDMML